MSVPNTAPNTTQNKGAIHDQSPPAAGAASVGTTSAIPEISTIGLPQPIANPGTSWSIDGIASPEAEPSNREVADNPAHSIGHLMLRRAAGTPDAPAYRFRGPNEEWLEYTWKEASDRILQLSAGLLAVGLTKDSAAALISGTRMEWVESDIAMMSIGVQSIAIYPSSIAEDLVYILNDSDSRVAIVEDASQVSKLLKIRSEIPNIEHVWVIDSKFSLDDAIADSGVSLSDAERDDVEEWISPITALFDEGKQYLAQDPAVVHRAIEKTDHETVACLQYTSGTTGKPKGAIITHGAWVKNVTSATQISSIYSDDVHFIWLPMAHLFGRYLVYLAIDCGIVTAIDGRIDKIVENLQDIKPTFMGGAPRIFEKAYSAIMAQFDGDGLKAKLGKVSMALALEDTENRLAGRRSSAWLRFKLAIADRVVLSKIRAALGGRVRLFISGSAPINQDITKWFTSVGMPIAEGYGLTEGCITHLTRLDAYRIGTIGWPLPGVEAKIADDGELLIKSDWNLKGYHNRPDATKEVLPGDGYMYTGDIARVENGYYYITDRKKALFKTSNGKYVAPAAIESEFKGLCPIAMELATYGEGHKYIVGMVVLEEKATRDWCEANGVKAETFAEMTQSSEVVEFIQGCVAKLNERLNTWEQVKRFRILDRELSMEKDELTASLKMRRNHVHTTMKDAFEELYSDPLQPGCYDSKGAHWVSFEQPALKEHPVLDDAHDIHLPRRKH